MKLIEMTVSEYLASVASDAPAPGGGSTAALCGAQGSGLAAMVAKLTIGKKKYHDDQELCIRVASDAEILAKTLEAQIDKDTEAYKLIAAAYKLPRKTEEEKALRKKAIADATLVATEVPFETMRMAQQGLVLVSPLVGHSNVNCASDLGVAALNLTAAMRGAWMNVMINVSGVTDEVRKEEFLKQGEHMFKECETIGKETYAALLASIGG